MKQSEIYNELREIKAALKELDKKLLLRDRKTLTVPEAAVYLGYHPQTVRNLLYKGVLPGKKIGSRRVIEKAVLDEYLNG